VREKGFVQVLIIISVLLVVIGVIFYLTGGFYLLEDLLSRPKVEQKSSPTTNKVGLWKDCDPSVNNCESGLECKLYTKNIIDVLNT